MLTAIRARPARYAPVPVSYTHLIPGTTRRALSWRKKVFQAAIIGRGSEVDSTVSSMSETMPVRTWGSMIMTLALTGSAPGAATVSYTHLDVYKRQTLARPPTASPRTRPGEWLPARHTLSLIHI